MKSSFKNTRVSDRWFIPVWLIIFTLFSQLAMAQATVTYSTVAVPAGTILRGNESIVYILKVVAGAEILGVTGLTVKTTGTYTVADISHFTLYESDSPSLESRISLGNSAGAPTGSGETLSWASAPDVPGLTAIARNSTTYLIVTATANNSGAVGKTVGINGAANALSISYRPPNSAPTVTNNQSNVAGLQTIVALPVTYSTEPLSAGNVIQGAADHLLYILKIVTGSAGPVSFNNLTIKTTGTFSKSDMVEFELWQNSTPSLTGAVHPGHNGSVAGHGETLSFGLDGEILAANSTTYFLITADLQPQAGIGVTFGIEGT